MASGENSWAELRAGNLARAFSAKGTMGLRHGVDGVAERVGVVRRHDDAAFVVLHERPRRRRGRVVDDGTAEDERLDQAAREGVVERGE